MITVLTTFVVIASACGSSGEGTGPVTDTEPVTTIEETVPTSTTEVDRISEHDIDEILTETPTTENLDGIESATEDDEADMDTIAEIGSETAPEDDNDDEEEPSMVLASQPVYSSEIGAETYFRELLAWISEQSESSFTEPIDTSDGLDTDMDQPTDADSQLAIETCLADQFIVTFGDDELTEIAEAIHELDLVDGLPMDVIQEEGFDTLTTNVLSCRPLMQEIFAEELASEIDLLEDMGAEGTDAQTDLLTGALSCLQGIMDDDAIFIDLYTLDIFDTGRTDLADEYVSLMFSICGEAFLGPLLIETFVTEMGIEREQAECLVSHLMPTITEMLESTDFNLDVLTGEDEIVAGDEAAEEAMTAMMMGMMTGFLACDLSPETLINMAESP